MCVCVCVYEMHALRAQMRKGVLTPHYDNEEEEDNDEAAGAIALLNKCLQANKLTYLIRFALSEVHKSFFFLVCFFRLFFHRELVC